MTARRRRAAPAGAAPRWPFAPPPPCAQAVGNGGNEIVAVASGAPCEVSRDTPYSIGWYPTTRNQPVKQPPRTRPYHAPRRAAAAAETRQAILRAAREEFDAHGW